MFLAILLGAFAAALAAPLGADSGDEADDAPGDTPADDLGPPEVLSLSTIDDLDAQAPGATVHVLEDFRPGEDRCELELDDENALIEAGWDDRGHPFFSVGHGDDALFFRFPGLSEVPADDVFVTVAEPDGDDPVTLSLSDILLRGALDELPLGRLLLDGGAEHGDDMFLLPLDDLGVLSPIGPDVIDAEDTLPDNPSGVVPLAPTGGDSPDAPGPSLPADHVLAPVAGNAPEVHTSGATA